MAFVVTANCFGCKHMDCVVECPCDCFHEGEQMLYIDPESCIDCAACAAVCPTQAIYADLEVPEELREFIALNKEMAPLCPSITEKRV